MKKALALVLAFFGWKELPKKDGQYQFSEEEKKQLNEAVGKETFAEDFLRKMNAQEENEKLTAERQAAADKLKKLLAENGIEDPASEEEEEEEAPAQTDAHQSIQKRIDALEERMKADRETIRKLGDLPEDDNAPELLIDGKKAQNLKHSATHMYGSGLSYDAFEGRNWNKNALALANNPQAKVQMTDWEASPNIDKINEDLGNYFRRELDQVIDFMADYRGIPSWWEVISNVSDQVAYTAMLTSEITQGRAKNWLPKNKQKFIAIKGEVYGVKIDIEYSGFELQKIERSWMNKYNQEGSQAYKMSFVRFLVGKLLMKARQEDSYCIIKGVYLPDELRTKAQSFIFRERGTLQLIKENRGKTYLPFDMAKSRVGSKLPTTSNIVDYVKAMCEMLPDDKRSTPGLIYYLSPTWYRAYQEKRKLLDGLMPTYQPGEMTVENFPNVTLYPLDYLDGEDIHWITTRDNHKILQNIEREKSLLQFERLKRDIYIFGDYKQGAHVDAFGAQWEDGMPVDYSNQQFWSNTAEVLLDVKVPLPADDATPSVQYHNVVKTGANTGATAITNLDDAVDGEFYYVYGNDEGTAATMASGANLDLASSITLSGDVMIKLYKRPGGKLVEIERKDLTIGSGVVELADGATTADADLGTHFITAANGSATAFTNIANAVPGTTYRIEGGSSSNATTIAQSGNFSRISAAITLNEGVWIDVLYNGSQFIELSRSA